MSPTSAGPQLILCLSPDTTQIVELSVATLSTLGRTSDNMIRVLDATVSRHHAQLTARDDGSCVVEDLQSANGTTLNQTRVTGRAEASDGDQLRFGTVPAVYLAAEATAADFPAPTLETGELFATRYRLENLLGDTPEFSNFLAVDLAEDQQRVSLKVFDPEAFMQATDFMSARAMFLRIKQSPDHPRLIRLQEFGRWRGRPYLADDLIKGFPLLDLLRARGAVDAKAMVWIAHQAAQATDYARRHGLFMPELAARAILVSFHQPIPQEEWRRLLTVPIENWPDWTLKIAPRLFAPVPAPVFSPLVELIYELLGHPLSSQSVARLPRVAALREQGNEALARWSAQRQSEDDVSLIKTLSQMTGAQIPAAHVIQDHF